MGNQRYPLCAYERPSTKAPPDMCCTLSYTLHSTVCLRFFLPVRYTLVLAVINTVYDILHVVQGFYIWDFEPSFGFPSLITGVVFVCFLFPGKVT